jgi:diketogulonate reductase-like aldo/keto reductase
LKAEVLDIALGMAIHAMTHHGISQPLIDTAVTYSNADAVAAAMRKYPNVRIGTKVHRAASIEADIAKEKATYGPRLHRILLHKHMPLESYLVLVKAKADGVAPVIGVSNYTAAQLEGLLGSLKELAASGDGRLCGLSYDEAKPAVVQNELHPFLRTTVPDVCAAHGMRFEAHSVFSFVDEWPVAMRDPDAKPSLGQRAMAFALQRGGGSVVFNTANYAHLLQNLDIVTLTPEQLAEIDALKSSACKARYAGSDTAAFRPQFSHNLDPAHGSGFDSLPAEYIVSNIAPVLRKDARDVADGKVPTKTANGISRLRYRKAETVAAHLALANAFFVDEATGEPLKFFAEDAEKDKDAKLKRLENALTKIRRALLVHEAELKKRSKPAMCKYRAIEDPEALPVDIPDPSVLQPFIDLVAATKELPKTAIRMERGVLFPDGRLDFCKQVAQPSFPKLCQAVLDSGAVKHFLIGNNVALADDADGTNERALGRLIRESKGIQTWYLAGNAIHKDAVRTVAEAVASNPDSRYLWLKMNPVSTGSYHLGKMLYANPKIEVLDLFNTGQLDDGLRAFQKGLEEGAAAVGADVKSGLKHLYLDINAITDGATAAAICNHFPSLESLSINVNQLKDVGTTALAAGLLALPVKPPLQRLVLGSNGCTNASLPYLESIVKAFPKLTILQLGSYKSTKFFQQQANRFSDDAGMLSLAKALAANAKASANPQLNFFGFQNAYVDSDASQVVLGIASLGLHANGVQFNSGGITTATSKQLNELLGTPTNVQPAPVEFIQSVYRNAM